MASGCIQSKSHWLTQLQGQALKRPTAHDFRHSWASWMSEKGVDPYTIMEIGGWSSMKVLERYLHRNRAKRQGRRDDRRFNIAQFPDMETVVEIGNKGDELNNFVQVQRKERVRKKGK
jgi:hypothetical protein